MKKFTLLMAIALVAMSSKAQNDTTVAVIDSTLTNAMSDTIRIGNIVIIKKAKTGGYADADDNGDNSTTVQWGRNANKKTFASLQIYLYIKSIRLSQASKKLFR